MATGPDIAETEPLAPKPSASFEQLGNEGRWHAPFFTCGKDIDIFCVGLWCPCILFGRNVEMLAEEGIGSGSSARRSCLTFCAIPTAFSFASLGLLAALGGFSAHPATSPLLLDSIQHGCGLAGALALAKYAFPTRRKLRELEGIPGSDLGDCCVYFWCPGLPVCQETAQLRHRQRARLDAEAGHLRTVAQAPPLQRMR